MKRKTTAASRQAKGDATSLKAYRFDVRLYKRFEIDCDRHLRNPRSVLEALILHWLETKPAQRDAIAANYQKSAKPFITK